MVCWWRVQPLGEKLSGFESRLCHLISMQSWASYFIGIIKTSLGGWGPPSLGGPHHWGIEIDVCELPCVKQIASRNILYSTANSAWCSMVTQIDRIEGLGGRSKSWFTSLYSLVAQMVKNLPGMQETQVQSISREDPLKKGMATLYSILAWRNLWTEEPGRLQSMGHKEPDITEQLTHTHTHPNICIHNSS